jgi:cytochrome c553
MRLGDGARKWIGGGLLALVTSGVALSSPRTSDLYDEALSLDAEPAHGAALYRQHCAKCHGPQALGKADEVIPSLAGQLEIYLVKELVDFAELDRTAPEMHRTMARPELDEPQAWRDLAAYLAKLPPNRKPQYGNGKDLERGARSYSMYCAMCHGTQGEGMERGVAPALSSQHYAYLVLQLRSFDTDHRLNMEAPILDHMAGLTRDDLRAIADYMSRTPRVAPGSLTVSR